MTTDTPSPGSPVADDETLYRAVRNDPRFCVVERIKQALTRIATVALKPAG
jgi:hypothetical protein